MFRISVFRFSFCWVSNACWLAPRHWRAEAVQRGAAFHVLLPMLAALLLGCWPGPAAAQGRVALVIGNAAYLHIPPLANPTADARAVAAELSRLGFEDGHVEPLLNLDMAGLLRAVRAFGERARGAELAVVYFSGHGLQLAPTLGETPESYLLPVDARLGDARDVPRETLALRELLAETADRSQGAVVILLDACRNNPAAARMAGQGTRGAQARSGLLPLSQASLPQGTLVSYATSTGEVAEDGTGRNSPYATALARHLRTPGEDVGLMLRRVRADVMQATNMRQRPEIVDNLNGPVVLAPVAPTPPARLPGQSSGADPRADDTALWAEVRDSTRPDDFEVYLRRFPEGLYAGLARNRLRSLEVPTSGVQAPTPQSPPDSRPAETQILPGTPDRPAPEGKDDASTRPRGLGVFGAWTAALFFTNGQKTCYAFTDAAGGPRPGQERVMLMVSHRPSARDTVVISASNVFQSGAQVQVAIGATRLSFYTIGATPVAQHGSAAVRAMRIGQQALVQSRGTSDGREATYTFSLAGFGAAYDTISQHCPAPS